MGGKIPRHIKQKVIRQWLQGLSREQIAKENSIGAGTISAIIKYAKREEDPDIDLLREVALILKRDDFDQGYFGFAIRLQKVMEENDINEDQLESLMEDVGGYCFKHGLSVDKFIDMIHLTYNLADTLNIRVDKLSEYIKEGNERVEQNQREIEDLKREKERAKEDVKISLKDLEEYKKDKPLIERNKELQKELEKMKAITEYNKKLEWELQETRKQKDKLYIKRIECEQNLEVALNELESARKELEGTEFPIK
ncbi:MAG TPA: hypothetical protein VIP70_00480 [Nitrososphaeraceae archaeon]